MFDRLAADPVAAPAVEPGAGAPSAETADLGRCLTPGPRYPVGARLRRSVAATGGDDEFVRPRTPADALRVLRCPPDNGSAVTRWAATVPVVDALRRSASADVSQIRDREVPPRTADVWAPLRRFGGPIRRHKPMLESSPAPDWSAKFQRRSANGGIFQTAERSLIAKDSIIEDSERQLAAQGSAVQVVPGEQFSPGYHRVRLTVRKERVGSLRGGDDVEALGAAQKRKPADNKSLQLEALEAYISINKGEIEKGNQKAARTETAATMSKEAKALREDGDTDLFLTIRDCHMTARLVMGDVGIGRGPASREERMKVSGPAGDASDVTPGIADTNKYSTKANRGAIGVLKQNFRTFDAVVRRTVPAEDLDGMADVLDGLRSINSEWSYPEAMKLYETIQRHPTLGVLFNRTYSINEYAKVAIGQALVTVNDEDQKKLADEGKFDGGRELWNYHWAGVILQDGRDYVTLEALADQNATTLTTHWMFKMYGTVDAGADEDEQARQRAQTFHGEQGTDPHTGTRPMTLGVGTQ